MYSLNAKIRDLTAYEPIHGDYKIRLDANESYMNLPQNLLDKIKDEVQVLNFNRYPDALAKELCEAFANFYNLDFDTVAAGNGSDELISVLFASFVMKGEAYATFEKDFSMYNFYGELSECKSILLKKEADFSIDVEKSIEICQKEKVKLLIFSNPCNPTSLGLKRAEVIRIIEALPETLVIVDEAYMDFWTESVLDKIGTYDNLMILKTCSKALGLAAMRVGFAVANKNLISAVKAVKSPYNTDSLSQKIATVVLSEKEFCKKRIEEITNATKEFYEILLPIAQKYNLDMYKSDTNFIVIKTEKSTEIFEYLLENKIAIRNFKTFLRLSAGSNFEMTETAKYIQKFFEEN